MWKNIRVSECVSVLFSPQPRDKGWCIYDRIGVVSQNISKWTRVVFKFETNVSDYGFSYSCAFRVSFVS